MADGKPDVAILKIFQNEVILLAGWIIINCTKSGASSLCASGLPEPEQRNIRHISMSLVCL
jgi:hypothetical protein